MKEFLYNNFEVLLAFVAIASSLILFGIRANKRENATISKFRNLVDKPAEKVGAIYFGTKFAAVALLIVAAILYVLVYYKFQLHLHEVINATIVSLGMKGPLLAIVMWIGEAGLSFLFLLAWFLETALLVLRAFLNGDWSLVLPEINLRWILQVGVLILAVRWTPVKLGWLIFLIPGLLMLVSIVWVYGYPEETKETIAQLRLDRGQTELTENEKGEKVTTGRWEERIRAQEFTSLWDARKEVARVLKAMKKLEDKGLTEDPNYVKFSEQLRRAEGKFDDELKNSLYKTLELLAGKVPGQYKEFVKDVAHVRRLKDTWRDLVLKERGSGLSRRHVISFEAKVENEKLVKVVRLEPQTNGNTWNFFRVKGFGPTISILIGLGLVSWLVWWIQKRLSKKKSE